MGGLMENAGRGKRLGLLLLLAFSMVMAHGEGVQAGNSSAGGGEAARLQRQIAANRAFQVKYNCDVTSSFACREIAARIASVSARLASLGGTAPQSRAKEVVKEKKPSRRTTAVAASQPSRPSPVAKETAKVDMRCVRLSDGYYFPTPNAGYNAAEETDKIVAQCRFICDDPAMDVYRMVDSDRNADDMVSLTTGLKYSELPNAGAYRSISPMRACDMNRFYKTVLAASPQSDAATQDQPVQEPVVQDPMDVALFTDVGLRGTTSFVPGPARKVRIVGTAYLPAN